MSPKYNKAHSTDPNLSHSQQQNGVVYIRNIAISYQLTHHVNEDQSAEHL